MPQSSETLSFDLVSFSAVLAVQDSARLFTSVNSFAGFSEFSASCQRCTPSKVVEFQAASMFLAGFAFLPHVFVYV